uniref:H15 domain-containing protein n=1 Tax=Medicago truncatula TaxID=3880 RepID=B7FGW3_MEDTR|nr:unknown [Medicago truncatula]AFK43801.1 unknown [Medicago truncatula]
MATQEVNKPLSLPPYPEMIMKALEALNEPNGSNKSSISNYIESIYGELPEGHSIVLANHLNQMKDNGDLVFAKNNYMKPDPNAPPKRGRGRPPKPKDPLAPPPAAVLSPNAPPKTPKPASSGRGRGRPKKVQGTENVSNPSGGDGDGAGAGAEVDDDDAAPSVAAVAVPTTSGRGRGRPPKVKPQMTEVSVES